MQFFVFLPAQTDCDIMLK